ncbi:hypothetical protein [Marinobacterium litorale]|uniref:hypothetical protein n=1 Tax=Marinobacterium litorale TaxID=404770 RepID=UPI000419F461|nr:hypothetical protein [Marinobacterium litorale]
MFVRVVVAIVACLLTLWVVQAFAKPAPWYWWESRVDGHKLCRQFDPGEGWRRAGGPYRDAQCRIPTVAPEQR